MQASGATCAGSAARGACVLLSDSLDDVRERNGEPPVSAVTIERGYPNLVLLPNCYRKISARYMYTVKNDFSIRSRFQCAVTVPRAPHGAWRAGPRTHGRTSPPPAARSGGPRQPRAGERGASNAPPRSAQTSPHRCHVRHFLRCGSCVPSAVDSTVECRVAAVCDDYLVSHNTTLSAGGRGGVRLLLVFPRSTIDNGKESAR